MRSLHRFLINKIITTKKKPFIFLLDFQLILSSYVLAFLLRLDFRLTERELKLLIFSLPLIFVVKLFSYLFFNLDKILWRYTSVKDLVAIIKAFTLSNIVYGTLILSLSNFEGYPRSIIIIDFAISVMLLGGIRLIYRVYFKQVDKDFKKNKKCLILGSGDAAELLIRQMIATRHIDYYPVGILDNNNQKWNRYLHGIKILGPVKDIYNYCMELNVEEIIIAIPSASSKEMKEIIKYCETCRDLGIEYKTVPSINDILFGKQSPSAIRDIRLEDLINRELVITNKIQIRKEYGNKIVIVTGSAGSIGSELSRQIADCRPSFIILIDRNENNLMYLEKELMSIVPKIEYKTLIMDITNQKKMEAVFDEFQPEYIFHAAAYKHVGYMENHPDEAVKNNIYGTFILAKLADKYRAKKFVMISTDKAVYPTSVMGCSKRVAELCLLNFFHNSKTEFIVVRFGNVIGSEGSVVPIFQKQIKKGGPVTVTDPKMLRYFMTIPEAVRLTLQAGSFGLHEDILILDMGEQIPILEIAENLITLSGFKPYVDIDIKFTGARPGEKLYEELWNLSEKPIRTNHPKIYKAANSTKNSTFNREVFFELISTADKNYDPDVYKYMLKILVPSYSYNPEKKMMAGNKKY